MSGNKQANGVGKVNIHGESSAPMIRLERVRKVYSARAEGDGSTINALDGVSLTVPAGEWIAMMGPSGSGKSTLVNLIGCLDRPSSGEIWLDGSNVAAMNAQELNRVRAEKLGFVFQQFHLIPYLTALENLMLSQYFHSMTDEKEALAALERVGLKDRATHLPAHLSGGEQQRVCIARALINDPKIILADEPTGNLDAENQAIVLRLLRELHQQGRTIVMVTHDPVVAQMADRRIELRHGRIASMDVLAISDEEQFDEVLEEMWVIEEHGETAELGRIEVEGALPMPLAIEQMTERGLLTVLPHPPVTHDHQAVVNPCHDTLKSSHSLPADGDFVIQFTATGRRQAADIIRRHRLAERLFTESLGMQNEEEIEQQACKFEHILSPGATERICTFLGHPKTCPHGAPIPPGSCCPAAGEQVRKLVEEAVSTKGAQRG